MKLEASVTKGGNTRLFSLARFALVEALRLLRISGGQKVLVPAFICRDVLAALHAVGASPIFYHVNQILEPESLPALPGAKAVMAINYFGFPQALDPFQAYCTKHGAALIEDNAHGFLSCDESGRPLGSRGDLAIASFRKTLAFPDGAALMVNREDWVDRLPDSLSPRTDSLPLVFTAKHVLRKVQNITGIPARSLGERVARHIRRIRTGRSLPVAGPESELRIPGHPAIHRESLTMLNGIDVGHEAERRRALYQMFHRDLRQAKIESIFADLRPGVVPYGYPFRATEDGVSAAVRIANRNGFDCFRWPELPAAVEPAAPTHYRNVWWINFLC